MNENLTSANMRIRVESKLEFDKTRSLEFPLQISAMQYYLKVNLRIEAQNLVAHIWAYAIIHANWPGKSKIIDHPNPE